MNLENDTFALVQRMRAMVYSSKDFESLWFLYQAEGLPKNDIDKTDENGMESAAVY